MIEPPEDVIPAPDASGPPDFGEPVHAPLPPPDDRSKVLTPPPGASDRPTRHHRPEPGDQASH